MAGKKGAKRLTRRPLVKGLNLDDIIQEMYAMQSECSDVAYAIDNDEVIEDALGGEEEAYEFRIAFVDLDHSLIELQDALMEEWVPECYDIFLPAIRAGEITFAYEEDEDDFAPLTSWQQEWQASECRDKLKRMTKDQLIEACAQCMSVLRMYLALRYRYDCLKGALDIIRGINRGIIDTVNQINDAHDKGEYNKIDRLAQDLPCEVWVT